MNVNILYDNVPEDDIQYNNLSIKVKTTNIETYFEKTHLDKILLKRYRKRKQVNDKPKTQDDDYLGVGGGGGRMGGGPHKQKEVTVSAVLVFILDRRFRNAYHIIKTIKEANKRKQHYVINQRLRLTQFCVLEFQQGERIFLP